MVDFFTVVIYIAITIIIGMLWGLIPFFLGRHRYKPNMGRLGLIWCGVAGPFMLSFFVMLGFVIAILVSERDARGVQPPDPQPSPIPPTSAAYARSSGASTGLMLHCIAGPLRGQSYPLTSAGLMIGRDADCSVRYPADASGVSRHHCALRWQQGVPMLVDLGSSYGTYLGDGRKLPNNYPMSIGPGTRFYLASPNNLFQLTTA